MRSAPARASSQAADQPCERVVPADEAPGARERGRQGRLGRRRVGRAGARRAPAAHLLDQLARLGGRHDAQLPAQPVAQRLEGGDRPGPVAGARQPADQVPRAALAQGVRGDAAPAPLDRPGVVAGRLGPGGQLAQEGDHLGPVLLAQPVGPLLVEPGQEVAVGERHRLLEPPVRDQAPGTRPGPPGPATGRARARGAPARSPARRRRPAPGLPAAPTRPGGGSCGRSPPARRGAGSRRGRCARAVPDGPRATPAGPAPAPTAAARPGPRRRGPRGPRGPGSPASRQA